MKYLAILRDSFREAVDSKVLYFTLGLSLLAIVCVSSIGFQAQSPEAGIGIIVRQFPAVGGMTYTVTDFRQLNDTSLPWEGEYRFQMVVREPEPLVFPLIVWLDRLQRDEQELTAEEKEARLRLMEFSVQMRQLPPDQFQQKMDERLRKELAAVTPAHMERFVLEGLSRAGNLETEQVHLATKGDKEYRFDVAVKPRPNAGRSWPNRLTLFWGALPLSEQSSTGESVLLIQDKIVGGMGAGITMLISAIITAFFIPNMLRKGTVDLLISKPIRRWTLLLYKYIGGLVFMFINTVVAIVGIWVVLGLRSGLWPVGFLLTIFVLTYQFAIFYAVSTLFAVLTRSPIVSILMSCLAWVILAVVGFGYLFVENLNRMPGAKPPEWVTTTFRTLRLVLPRYKDLDVLTSLAMVRDLLPLNARERASIEATFGEINWGESLGVTTAYIVVLIGLACWRFASKDY